MRKPLPKHSHFHFSLFDMMHLSEVISEKQMFAYASCLIMYELSLVYCSLMNLIPLVKSEAIHTRPARLSESFLFF